MARHAYDADSPADRPRNKPWFLPVIGGIVAVGLIVAFLARSYHGPSQPLINTPAEPASGLQGARTEIAQARALLDQAWQSYEANQYEQALAQIDQVLQRFPELTSARFAAGRIAMDMGAYERARREFEIVLQKQPNDAQTLAYLASLAVLRKDYAGARDLLERARPGLQRDGKYAPATLVLMAAANVDDPATAVGFIRDSLADGAKPEILVSEANVYGPSTVAIVAEALAERDAAVAADAYAQAARTATDSDPKAEWEAKAGQLRARIQASQPASRPGN